MLEIHDEAQPTPCIACTVTMGANVLNIYAYLPTLPVFPGVSKFFIKSPGLSKCLLGDFQGLFLDIVFNDILKACLHRQFLWRQLNATFVASKLQLQNRMCKPGVIFSVRFVAAISQWFRTRLKLHATFAGQKSPV